MSQVVLDTKGNATNGNTNPFNNVCPSNSWVYNVEVKYGNSMDRLLWTCNDDNNTVSTAGLSNGGSSDKINNPQGFCCADIKAGSNGANEIRLFNYDNGYNTGFHGADYSGDSSTNFSCPPGKRIVGFHGTSGNYIGQLGVVCQDWVDCSSGDNIINNSYCNTGLKQNDNPYYTALLSNYCIQNNNQNMSKSECQQLLHPETPKNTVLTTSNECKTSTTNTQLQSACSCEKDSNALISAVDSYQNELQKYNIAMAVHNNQTSAFNDWNSRKTKFLNSISTETVRGYCAPAGNCGASTCPAGWVSDGSITGNHDNCEVCLGIICGLTGCAVNCVRDPATLQAALQPWLFANPQPNVIAKPSPPNAPTGNNVQCCSQLFANITATSANFSDIQQQCSQLIQDKMSSAINPTTTPVTTTPSTTTPNGSTTTTPSTTTPSTSTTTNSNTQTYIIIGIVVAILAVIFLFSAVGIVLFS